MLILKLAHWDHGDYDKFKALVGELNDESVWYVLDANTGQFKVVAIGTLHKWNVTVMSDAWSLMPASFLADFPSAIDASTVHGVTFKIDGDLLWP
jgi:hypothetical protein